ncbi:HTH-type transcriptional activator mta [compost metagenome]
MSLTVKSVAKLAGVSVRTLHHYDEIGLLRPAALSDAGYRQYSDADLERLQQILFFRELDFSLQEIKQILERPDFDRREALLTHRRLLTEKQTRLQAILRSVDQTLEAMGRGETMEKDVMFEVFNDPKLKEYQEEARQRWGGSDAYAESERRTRGYSKQDWITIKAEMEAVTLGMASAMGHDPASPEVQAKVGAWFELINQRFYTCTPEIFRGLGEMYVADPRFTATYEKVKPGLAEFMRDAMAIYADRLEAERQA